jgi:hypothetical protein
MHEPMKTSSILVAGDFGQQLHVVRVVRAGQDRLGDVGQVDLDHGGVLGVGVGLQQLGRWRSSLPWP